jgi:hypothetical protein
MERLCGLEVRVRGYKSRVLGFDYQRYHIFCEAVGLERGLLSLVTIIEGLLQWKSSGSGLENRNYRSWGPVVLTNWHASTRKSWHSVLRPAAVGQSV